MRIIDFLKQEENKVLAYITSKTPAFITSIKQVETITTGLLAWAKSPQGQTIQQVADALVPQALSWTEKGLAVVTDLGADLTAISNPANWEAIAERIGGELLYLAEGGTISSISEGIAEFQKIFLG